MLTSGIDELMKRLNAGYKQLGCNDLEMVYVVSTVDAATPNATT